MLEAENLCDRIGIMNKGNLKCLGTAQHLKHKYDHAYQLYIKSKHKHNINIKQQLKNGKIILRFSRGYTKQKNIKSEMILTLFQT